MSAPLPPTSDLLRAYQVYLRMLSRPLDAGESVLEHWGQAHVAACRALEAEPPTSPTARLKGDGADKRLDATAGDVKRTK